MPLDRVDRGLLYDVSFDCVMLGMTRRHDRFLFMSESTLTERGQISVPAELRKAMNLRPGQRLKFVPLSDNEFRVLTLNYAPPGPMAMLGYARKLRAGRTRRTSELMREIREGERKS
jgi:AbrB family looped-hinge helix DNA binding protein